MSDKDVVNALNMPISKKNLKKVWICALVILLSILMHDGNHLRQAFNWGYSIPFALLVLNLVVYLFPAFSLTEDTRHIVAFPSLTRQSKVVKV